MSPKPKYIAFGVVCIFDLIVIIFAIIILSFASSAKTQAQIDLSLVEQVQEDWDRVPLTELIVRKDERCHQDEVYAFKWLYYGTHQGCLTNYRSQRYRSSIKGVETIHEFNQRAAGKKQHQRPKCDSVSSIPASYVALIGGVAICGKQAGDSFVNVTRPDPQTLKCPSGTYPCSNYTSIQNTVCYPQNQLQTLCPITSVQFFEANSTEQYAFESQNASQGAWIKKDAYPGYVMFYTTSAVDALPLGKTLFTFKPCMRDDEVETDPSNRFYTLERQQKEKCSQEFNTNEKYDPRYNYLGYEIDEYTLLDESGLFEQLLMKPFYSQEVRNAPYIKKNVQQFLWARQTIPYSLACDANIPRDKLFVKLAENPRNNLSAISGVSACATFSIVFSIFCGIIVLCTSGIPDSTGKIINGIFVGVKGGLQMMLGIFAVQNSYQIAIQLVQGQNRLNTASLINGCSDQYTKIDVQHYTNQLIQANQTMDSMPGLAITMLVFICCSVTSLCCACCIGCADKDD